MSEENPDLKIAQAATLEPITDIAERAGIPAEALIPYGHTKAKVDPALVPASGSTSKLVLVSAMSPTPAGEGKSTTTVGVADAWHVWNAAGSLPPAESWLGAHRYTGTAPRATPSGLEHPGNASSCPRWCPALPDASGRRSA